MSRHEKFRDRRDRVSLINYIHWKVSPEVRKLSPRTDSSPELVRACDCASWFAASGNCDTASVHRADSISYQARPWAACCTIHRRNSRRGSPCPLTQRAPFLRCWRRGFELAWCLKRFSILFKVLMKKLNRNFTFLASSALRCEEMMIIVHAVNLVVDIDREWNAIKAFIAHATSEASRVIRFSHCVQNL